MRVWVSVGNGIRLVAFCEGEQQYMTIFARMREAPERKNSPSTAGQFAKTARKGMPFPTKLWAISSLTVHINVKTYIQK